MSAAQLRTRAAPGNELTWTVVAKGTETRIGVDEDQDGVLDQDEQEGAPCRDNEHH